jgi:hypothetical protein
MRLYILFFETSFFGGVAPRDILTELAELIEHGIACMWGLEAQIQGRVDEGWTLRARPPIFLYVDRRHVQGDNAPAIWFWNLERCGAVGCWGIDCVSLRVASTHDSADPDDHDLKTFGSMNWYCFAEGSSVFLL